MLILCQANDSDKVKQNIFHLQGKLKYFFLNLLFTTLNGIKKAPYAEDELSSMFGFAHDSHRIAQAQQRTSDATSPIQRRISKTDHAIGRHTDKQLN